MVQKTTFQETQRTTKQNISQKMTFHKTGRLIERGSISQRCLKCCCVLILKATLEILYECNIITGNTNV